MTDRFQIKVRHQLNSYEKGFITFSLAFIGAIIGGLFGIFGPNDFPLFVLTCILFSLPAFYLHITYLIDNWGTILIMDKSQSGFTIKTREMDFNYTNEDIENTELNLGIYYKNQLDNRRRWPAPWTNYGYLRLKLKDGKVFYFTSLMLDLDILPFPVTVTRFRSVPFIDKT